MLKTRSLTHEVENYTVVFRPNGPRITPKTIRTYKRLQKYGPPKYLRDYIEVHRKYYGWVYLIHFDEPYYHARHYLGFTKDVDLRMLRHSAGNGSRLMAAVKEAGIEWYISKVWWGDRYFERELKKSHNVPRLCPTCKERENGTL